MGPWGYVFYQEADRWRPIDQGVPCKTEDQVIREARDRVKILSAAMVTTANESSYNWRSGSPDDDGAFERNGRPLVAPSRIEDLGISQKG
jgi:hypothetical protein